MTQPSRRIVRANLSLTLDGRYHGSAGPADLSVIVPYAVTEVARDHLARVIQGATTAVLARRSAEGFIGYWSQVAEDESADPRDRGYATWLRDVEKVVLSTTLTEPPWARTRVVNAPAPDVIRDLQANGEGDILVNSSPSIIRPLLAADLIDRLYLIIAPEIAGAGARLFDGQLPATRWALARVQSGERGELSLIYDRVR